MFNLIRYPYYGQLTAYKTENPLTSHMTVSQAQMPNHRGHMFFFKFSADQLLAYN